MSEERAPRWRLALALVIHFQDTKTCEQLLVESGINVSRFPFACDDAAVHQVLPDGWMWQLRYDDNSLSAGFMIDQRSEAARRDMPTFASAADEWARRVERSGFLKRQFSGAYINRPASGLASTSRIQRLTTQAAGTDWAALTNTAGFIDPLHSTGIAHTLFSVARLAEILTDGQATSKHERLQSYSVRLIEEIRCVDELVEGCYAGIPDFRLWCLWGMLYFAAATSMEQSGDDAFSQVSFLRANDSAFRNILAEGRARLPRGSSTRYGGRGISSEVENGEVVVITDQGLESHRPFPKRPARPCIFEYIYFARPDSIVGGRTVYDIRKQMGIQLACEAPANADVIVPIPDSGVPAAIGFSQESGIPFELGIIRNHYVGRTFIEPEQRIRQLGVKLKHSANSSVIRGNCHRACR